MNNSAKPKQSGTKTMGVSPWKFMFLEKFFNSRLNGQKNDTGDVGNLLDKYKLQIKELEERNRNLATIQEVSRIILQTTDVSELTQKILNLIPPNPDYLGGILAIIDLEKDEIYIDSISDGVLSNFLRSTILGIRTNYSGGNSFLVQVAKEDKPIINSFLSDFISRDKTKIDTLANQTGIKTVSAYPISGSFVRATGVLIFCLSKENHEVDTQDKQFMSTFADEIGISLERIKTINALRTINTELMKGNIHLKELERAKDEFISVVSHELRTPMTVIKSYLWLSLNGKAGKLNPQLVKYLEKAYISSGRLINLVSDMLSVSRIETGRVQLNLEPVQIEEVIKDEVAQLKVKAKEKNIKLKFMKPQPQLPRVLADSEKIREVITNLTGNAIKFTQNGGFITITGKTEKDMVRIEVTDTGKGIAKEDLPKLFKKFGRLDNSFVTIAETGGTGLGLYITKSLVELHGGTVDVKSEPEKGSTFFFTLKIAKE